MAKLVRLVFFSILGVALALPCGSGFAQPSQTNEPVRIGLTAVFLDDQIAFLNLWRDYLQNRLKRPVVFVQRKSYREITNLLRQDKLDFAWVCGAPYVRNRQYMKLLAVPVFRGKPLYQSYLIVPASDTTTRSLPDLRGKVFAYSDPDSNSGYLVNQYSLHRLNEKPDSFYRKSFFTWAHRKVVEAVASGLAQGGSVDGYVWETLRLSHPELTSKTRIVQKSPEFGHPPFVARQSVPQEEFGAMQKVLLEMSGNAEGAVLLKTLNLDGFTSGEPRLFDSIARMAKVVDSSYYVAAP